MLVPREVCLSLNLNCDLHAFDTERIDRKKEMETTMKLEKLVTVVFVAAATSFATLATGCAADDVEQPSTEADKNEATVAASEATPAEADEESNVASTSSAVTTCVPAGTCAKASRSCRSPQLDPSWCAILARCFQPGCR